MSADALSSLITLPNPAVGATPLRPGASIGREKKGRAGSMGALVFRSGVAHMLTADHVFRQGGAPKKGEQIFHPGPGDTDTSRVVVARFVETHFGAAAGIARLEPTVGASNNALLSGVRIGPPQIPRSGDVLAKSGLMTKITTAIVREVRPFDRFDMVVFLEPQSGNTDPLSLDGDSGSVWYDTKTFAAKGLHIGIHKDSGLPIASQMTLVMQRLALSWA